MARKENVEGGVQAPKRRRRAPFIVWGIIGSVLLVTASAVFGAMMYNWSHHPAYQHKDDSFVYNGAEVKFNCNTRVYTPNSERTGTTEQKDYVTFTQKDETQTALCLERLNNLADEFPEDRIDFAGLIEKYNVSVAALESLKDSKITVSSPEFLKNEAAFSIDKGETNFAKGIYYGARNSSDISIKDGTLEMSGSKLLAAKTKNNGHFCLHYKGDNSTDNVLEFYFYASYIQFNYQEYSTYINSKTSQSVKYCSLSVDYQINFHGYYSLVKEAAK